MCSNILYTNFKRFKKKYCFIKCKIKKKLNLVINEYMYTKKKKRFNNLCVLNKNKVIIKIKSIFFYLI